MKKPRTVEGRRSLAVFAPFLAAVSLTCTPWAEAIQVDAELVMLVDVTQSVSGPEFGLMMEGIADGWETSALVNAIHAGDIGSIAASLVFYSGRNNQTVGVGWMEISDLTSAQSFANLIRNAARPFSQPRTGVAGALDFAAGQFGTETGGTGNGFESQYQGITFVAEGIDDHSPTTGGSREVTVQNSRDNALAAGVDFINALTVGAPGTVDDWFTQNVIGGSVDGDTPEVLNAPDFAGFDVVADVHFGQTVLSIVPEPGTTALVGAGLLTFLLPRRRKLT